MFIYKMPYDVRRKLVDVLDTSDFWRDLGGRRLNYSIEELNKFRTAIYKPGDSPADALLTHWGQKNHTVTELFKHLYAMKHFQALDIIKDCVPEKYHKYIKADAGQVMHSSSMRSGGVATVHSEPPSPPKEYRLALRDKVVAENFSLLSAPLDKYGSKLRELDKLNSFPPLTTSSSNLCADDAPLDEGQENSSEMMNDPALVGINIPSMNTESARGAGTYLGTTPTTQASSMSRLKQQTPSKIPIPNPELMLRNVEFEELRMACNNFSPSNLLGRGGFGEVYLGKWNGQSVAVKRIREERRRALDGDEKYVNQAITELQALHNYPAENVLPLLAFSFSETMKTDPCLVYLYMPNGSVADQLRNRGVAAPPLNWATRANIALGTARGLCHLHANNIIHGDIKCANILLDRHFEAKIGDFGLARGGPESDAYSYKLVSTVQGTAAYLPHDYVRSRHLTPAVDTFCYGIMLFELVTGKRPSWVDPVSNTMMREIMLNASSPEPWVDPTAGAGNENAADWPKCLFMLGRDCTKSRRKHRPEMRVVLSAMERLHRYPQMHQIETDRTASKSEEKALAYLTLDDVPMRNEQQQQQQPATSGKWDRPPSYVNNNNQGRNVPMVIPTILNSTGECSAPAESKLSNTASESMSRTELIPSDDDDDDDDTTSDECNESRPQTPPALFAADTADFIPEIIHSHTDGPLIRCRDPEPNEPLPTLVERLGNLSVRQVRNVSEDLESDAGEQKAKEAAKPSKFEIPDLPDMSFYLRGRGDEDIHGFGRFMAAEAAASDASALDLLIDLPTVAKENVM